MSDYYDLDPLQRKVVDEVLKRYGLEPESRTSSIMGAASAGLGSAANTMAANRGAKIQAGLAAEEASAGRRQYLLDRDRERMASGNNAMREAQVAKYIAPTR